MSLTDGLEGLNDPISAGWVFSFIFQVPIYLCVQNRTAIQSYELPVFGFPCDTDDFICAKFIIDGHDEILCEVTHIFHFGIGL